MLVYWLLLGFFVVGALIVRPRSDRRPGGLMLVVGALLIALAIGLRNEVGADWEPYKFMFSFAGYADL